MFAQLHRRIARERVLNPMEFCLTLTILSVSEEECGELLLAMGGTKRSKGVSLHNFFKALVSACSDALLWEMRCHYEPYYGLLPADMMKVSRHIERWGMHKGEETNCLPAAVAQTKPRNQEVAIPFRLRRPEWLKFCTAMGLTLFEAQRLFDYLREDGNPDVVDLRSMFEELRATVAPNVSLRSFTKAVFDKHGSLRAGFRNACGGYDWQEGKILDWHKFQKLVEPLIETSERIAIKLWDMLHIQDELSASLCLMEKEEHSNRLSMSGFSEDTFVRLLIPWAPNTALETLKHELREHCGSVAKGHQALMLHGLPGQSKLTPSILKAALRDIGITTCDSDLVLRGVLDARKRDLRRDRDACIAAVMLVLGNKRRAVTLAMAMSYWKRAIGKLVDDVDGTVLPISPTEQRPRLGSSSSGSDLKPFNRNSSLKGLSSATPPLVITASPSEGERGVFEWRKNHYRNMVGEVTLDDIAETLRAAAVAERQKVDAGICSDHAHDLVKHETLPVWQQLRDVQTALQRPPKGEALKDCNLWDQDSGHRRFPSASSPAASVSPGPGADRRHMKHREAGFSQSPAPSADRWLSRRGEALRNDALRLIGGFYADGETATAPGSRRSSRAQSATSVNSVASAASEPAIPAGAKILWKREMIR